MSDISIPGLGSGKYNTKEIWRDKDDKDLPPHTNYCVGGNTKFYGAALFRLRKEDFGEIRHHGGLSPAWPIAYEDLEPYYTLLDYLVATAVDHQAFRDAIDRSRARYIPALVLTEVDYFLRHERGAMGAR